MNKKPLVSICIPNYNYARYLPRCLDSVLGQYYDNIEVIFNDNNSTDTSFDIAIDYIKLFKERSIYYNIGKNRYNVGSDSNCNICRDKSVGKYIMYLSSDDALRPHFIEKMVEVMEKYPNTSMIMAHRCEIDEEDHIKNEVPFFNKNFVCPGEEMATVYMMAGIAVPSQILMRRASLFDSIRYSIAAFHVAGDWYSNFKMACVGDIAYLKECLVEYRVHAGNETNESEKKMLGVFEHYQLLEAFMRTADMAGFTRPQKRFEEARAKLGFMCLRYAHKMLRFNEDDTARRYLALSQAFKPEIIEEALFTRLQTCIGLPHDVRNDMLDDMATSGEIRRTVSYDPPIHYTEI